MNQPTARRIALALLLLTLFVPAANAAAADINRDDSSAEAWTFDPSIWLGRIFSGLVNRPTLESEGIAPQRVEAAAASNSCTDDECELDPDP